MSCKYEKKFRVSLCVCVYIRRVRSRNCCNPAAEYFVPPPLYFSMHAIFRLFLFFFQEKKEENIEIREIKTIITDDKCSKCFLPL